MKGIPEQNHPAFFKAEKKLKLKGHKVFNPARKDRKKFKKDFATYPVSASGFQSEIDTKLRDVLALDTAWICRYADAIALLPGWEWSNGARAEWSLSIALGLRIMYL